MLFVGAANSPSGISSNFQGTRAPDQLEPKMKRNIVVTKGTQGLYRDSPRLFFAMSDVKPSAISWKLRTPVGAWKSDTGALACLATAAPTLTMVRAVKSNDVTSVAPEKALGAAPAAAVGVPCTALKC